jgi:hypothetical protein
MSLGRSTVQPRPVRNRKAHEKAKSDWERMLECVEKAARQEDCPGEKR